MNLRHILAGALLALGLAAAAAAHEVVYVASLNGPTESPPNASLGTGTARITFDLDLATMHVEASFSGLTGLTTAAHIHCCTAIAGVSTIGVATQTPTFTGFPLGVTSGTYDHVFDMALASSYNAPFITNNGGTVSGAFNALLLGLDAGKAYFNIHTSTSMSGEIRGFLAPVPEPATYATLALGLAVLSLAARRRRRV